MNKLTIYILIILATLQLSLAYDECKSQMITNELPCTIFLPLNTSIANCSVVNISFYSNSTFLYSEFMGNYTPFLCNSTFNQTNTATYTFSYSTGDSGSITITQDTNTIYYFWVITLLFVIFLVWMGYYKENIWLISLGGMLCAIVGITIFFNGFPNINNEVLKNSVSAVVTGIGMFLMLAPLVDWISEQL